MSKSRLGKWARRPDEGNTRPPLTVDGAHIRAFTAAHEPWTTAYRVRLLEAAESLPARDRPRARELIARLDVAGMSARERHGS